MITVPAELAECDHSVTFDPGRFLYDIRENWKKGGKPNTRLTQEEMASFEQLDWFPNVLAGWKRAREDPAGQ